MSDTTNVPTVTVNDAPQRDEDACEVLTVEEAARLLRISRGVAYSLARS